MLPKHRLPRVDSPAPQILALRTNLFVAASAIALADLLLRGNQHGRRLRAPDCIFDMHRLARWGRWVGKNERASCRGTRSLAPALGERGPTGFSRELVLVEALTRAMAVESSCFLSSSWRGPKTSARDIVPRERLPCRSESGFQGVSPENLFRWKPLPGSCLKKSRSCFPAACEISNF
jgi:hypothetical protein